MPEACSHRAIPSPLTTCGPTSSISIYPPSSRAVERLLHPSLSPSTSLSTPPTPTSFPPPEVYIPMAPPATVVAHGPTNGGPRGLPRAGLPQAYVSILSRTWQATKQPTKEPTATTKSSDSTLRDPPSAPSRWLTGT